MVALLLLTAALWWARRPEPSVPTAQPAATNPALPPPVTPVAPPAAGVLPALASLNATGSPEEDVRLLAQAFVHYQRMVKDPGGNPVGLNQEITRALCGRNPARLAFLAPNHPAINKVGELCDRWGQPYFFHALSGRHMEIRSSGPDQRRWTEDDIVSPEARVNAPASRPAAISPD